MLLTLGLHKNSLVRSYSEHRILTPKIPKQSGKTVVTILVTTVSIFRMVLSASRRLPCGERPERWFFAVFISVQEVKERNALIVTVEYKDQVDHVQNDRQEYYPERHTFVTDAVTVEFERVLYG